MWGAIASIAGSLISSRMKSSAAQSSRDYTERMSGTAHQREVKDLRAAGLNPILSARFGGASTPSAAPADVPDFGASAKSSVMTNAELGLIKSETQKNQAEMANQSAQARSHMTTDAINKLSIPRHQVDSSYYQDVHNSGHSTAYVAGAKALDTVKGMIPNIGFMLGRGGKSRPKPKIHSRKSKSQRFNEGFNSYKKMENRRR